MRLLILTQKVDVHDPVLGFFHLWIEEFAKHCEQVTVIALGVGEYHLPQNVRVFSLGKEQQLRKRTDLENLRRSVLGEHLRKIKYLARFYALIWRERKNYDAVFVHMNPVYAVLGGFLWRVWSKKVALWYTHKSVDFKLRIAEKFAHIIFTASDESLHLVTPKKRVMGHGVSIEPAQPQGIHPELRLVMVGRLSPVKRVDMVTEAVRILKARGSNVTLKIIGGEGTPEQKVYEEGLKKRVREYGLSEEVLFLGALPPSEIPACLRESDLFVTTSDTGSLDKAPLEAMAVGVPVLASLPALESMLSPWKNMLYCMNPTPELIAEKIATFSSLASGERADIGAKLREEVVRIHSLPPLIKRIVEILIK